MIKNGITYNKMIRNGLTYEKAFLNGVQVFGSSAPPGSDADADLFITNAGITNTTQKSALQYLFINLKSAGLYEKAVGFYPLVGGSANSHKFNGKDPRDLDVAKRLVFYGPITHSANGIQGNGGGNYVNTFIVKSNFTQGQTLAVYLQENPFPTDVAYDISAIKDANGYNILYLANGSTGYTDDLTGSNSSVASGTVLTNTGFIIGTTFGTALSIFHNGNKRGSGVLESAADPLASFKLMTDSYDGGNTGAAGYSRKRYAFVFIGNGLSDSEAVALNTIVQQYQTILGRNV